MAETASARAASPPKRAAVRYIGLDIHKAYFVATGVNAQQQIIFGPQRVTNAELENWVKKHLNKEDAVVLEMTTNTYLFYDLLEPLVHSVTVVHPPHVALITRAQVKTDRKAAHGLAQLHAAGLLVSIWIPPQPVREMRALIAQRYKMVRLCTLAKNRLANVLHRHNFDKPPGSQPFHLKHKDWWLALPIKGIEKINLECDWEMVEFAERMKKRFEQEIAKAAASDPRAPLLVQLPGLSIIGAVTVLAAIGDIKRFPDADHLTGYAGLGARVHISGQMHQTGRITKAGRKDLRYIMVEAANHASRGHPKWKELFKKLEPRLGRSKALVAIARKMLVVIWHLLTDEAADKFSDPHQVACAMYAFFYKVGARNMPPGLKALPYVRQQLDRLGLDCPSIRWGRKRYKIPPSPASQSPPMTEVVAEPA
ncbi:MAG: IS110 family transposase [Anaerolineae bacterium]|nr:IS110 family transposase [Anaerolineae bacterium]